MCADVRVRADTLRPQFVPLRTAAATGARARMAAQAKLALSGAHPALFAYPKAFSISPRDLRRRDGCLAASQRPRPLKE